MQRRYNRVYNGAYGEWVDGLRDGDYVDCIKMNRVSGRQCWSRGQIMFRSEKDLSIRFLNEMNRGNDRVVSVESGEVMEYKSRSVHYEELMELKEGDLVDGCDSYSIWIRCTVL